MPRHEGEVLLGGAVETCERHRARGLLHRGREKHFASPLDQHALLPEGITKTTRFSKDRVFCLGRRNCVRGRCGPHAQDEFVDISLATVTVVAEGAYDGSRTTGDVLGGSASKYIGKHARNDTNLVVALARRNGLTTAVSGRNENGCSLVTALAGVIL